MRSGLVANPKFLVAKGANHAWRSTNDLSEQQTTVDGADGIGFGQRQRALGMHITNQEPAASQLKSMVVVASFVFAADKGFDILS